MVRKVRLCVRTAANFVRYSARGLAAANVRHHHSSSERQLVSGPVRMQGRIRFGEDFEFDLRAYDLRHAGRALKVERIPMNSRH